MLKLFSNKDLQDETRVYQMCPHKVLHVWLFAYLYTSSHTPTHTHAHTHSYKPTHMHIHRPTHTHSHTQEPPVEITSAALWALKTTKSKVFVTIQWKYFTKTVIIML